MGACQVLGEPCDGEPGLYGHFLPSWRFSSCRWWWRPVRRPWARTNAGYKSPDNSWTDSPAAYYGNTDEASLTLVSPIDLSGTTAPQLKFWHHNRFEAGYDFGYIEVKTSDAQNPPWRTIASYSGSVTNPAGNVGSASVKSQESSPEPGSPPQAASTGPWVLEQLSLAAYAGQPSVLVRFRIETDASVVEDGWYLDDIAIGDLPAAVTLNPVAGPTKTSLGLSWSTSDAADFASYKVVRSESAGVTLNDAVIATLTGNNQLIEALPNIANPDLVITEITWTPLDIVDGGTVSLVASVNNQGVGDTLKDFFVRFEVDGNLVGSQKVTGIEQNETRQITPNWIAGPGPHVVRALADSTGTISEDDESNNDRQENSHVVLASDLLIAEMDWNPATFEDGALVTISARVENWGSGDTLRSFAVRFEVDGVNLGSRTVSGLASGDFTVVNRNWIATPGTHVAKAIADANNAVVESDGNNNERTIGLPEVTAGDLLVTEIIEWLPAGQVEYRDGGTVNFTATVENRGSGDTTREFRVGFEVDGAAIGSHLVSAGLAVGGEVDVTQSWTATPGVHTVKAIADNTGVIVEINEGNNDRSKELAEVPAADLLVSGIALPPGYINDGDQVPITATVRNDGGSTVRGFYVRFEVDGQLLGRNFIPNGLAAVATVDVVRNWTAIPGVTRQGSWWTTTAA